MCDTPERLFWEFGNKLVTALRLEFRCISGRPPTRGDMVVDDPGRLHQRVTRGRSEEHETTPFELLGHGLRLVRDRRDVRHPAPPPPGPLGRVRPEQLV